MILAPLGALRVLKLAGLTLLAVFALGATAAQADNTYQVTRNDDPPNDGCSPGDCSLREALVDSNANPGNNTVNVPANTYLLDGSLGNLYIGTDGSVAIKGAGARNTIIDAQGNDRVLYVDDGDVSLSGLTITGGDNAGDGGGIYIDYDAGNVTLTNVAVKGNRAAGGCDSAERACARQGNGYSGDGGGIYNGSYSTLAINESEISGNTATSDDYGYGDSFAAGGGIFNEGRLELRNVTINGNVAESVNPDPPSAERSYYFSPGIGGGIYQSTSYDAQSNRGDKEFGSDLVNVTIANNTAGLGGGIGDGYPLSGDERVDVSIPVTVEGSIVADNLADYNIDVDKATGGSDNCSDPYELIVSIGNNIETDTSCSFTAAGDQQNTNPLLGALANNGGQTDTQALGDGSPALDKYNTVAASNSAKAAGCLPTDQRGVTRPQGPACDVGAYEKEVAAGPAATTGGTEAVKVQSKPSASSSASGPKSCVTKTARVRVSGKNISTVTYSLDGKKIRKAKGNKTSVSINARHLRSGVHRVTAKVTYTGATGAKAQTKRITFSRCARKAVKPKFTG